MTKALELAKFGREVPPTGLVVGDSDTQTLSAKTFSDMPVLSAGIVNGVAYLNGSKALTTSSNLIFNGTILTVSDIRDSSLTSGRVTYAGAAGNLIDSANLVFDGTNLGIGTSSPARQLVVYAPSSASATIQLVDSVSGAGAAAGSLFQQSFADQSLIIRNYAAAGYIRFDTVGASEKMRLDASGNLGIGTTSPTARLTVSGAAGNANGLMSVDGSDFIRVFGDAAFGPAINWSTGDSLRFATSDTAFGSFTERARISSAGNLSLGSVNNPSDPGILVSRGNNTSIILLDDEATGRGAYIRSTGSSVEFGSTSSVRPVVFTLDRVERARIDTAGNFLVGTNTLASGFASYAQIQASGTTGGVLINSATNNIGRLMFTNNNTSGGEGLIRYDGNDKSMQFWASAGERMRITSTGNVGIGTTNPITTLQVNAAAPAIRIQETATGGDKRLEFGVTSAGVAYIGANQSAQALTFQTVGSEHARISAIGNFGVGTTNPLHKFQVNNPSNTGRIAAFLNTNAGTVGVGDNGFIHIGGTHAGNFYGVDIGFVNSGVTPSVQQSNMVFRTAAGEETPQERMRISYTGNVGINTTNPTQLLDVRSANVSGATGATIRVGSQNHGGSGDEFANLEFFWGDPDGAGVKAKIYAKNVGNIGPGGGGAADLLIATTPAGGSLTDRMRITSTGVVSSGNVEFGRVHTDIMAMWRTADMQGYTTQASDGGGIGYTWDNGIVRVDNSVGSHNWDIGKIRLAPGTYQLVLVYRPSPTAHEWNNYGTNSNGHAIRLQSDAEYATRQIFISAEAYAINKDLKYSITYTSSTYTVTTDTTFRIGMSTDPYSGGGYKYYVEAAYLMRLN